MLTSVKWVSIDFSNETMLTYWQLDPQKAYITNNLTTNQGISNFNYGRHARIRHKLLWCTHTSL